MFIDRDAQGIISGVYVSAQCEGQESLPDDDAELIAYYAPKPLTNAELLAETDKYMNRACEDLIVMLLNKGAINKSDYPQIVWDRINYRRSLRNQQPV